MKIQARWPFRAIALLAFLAAASWAASSPAGSSSSAEPRDKVEAAVFEQLAAGKGEATFWALLTGTADLAGAEALPSDARGRFVYDRLTSFAELSQAGLRAFLTERGAAFRPFWIVNTIWSPPSSEMSSAVGISPAARRACSIEVGHLAGRGLDGAEGDDVGVAVDGIREAPERHRPELDAAVGVGEEREEQRGEVDLGRDHARAVRERGCHEADELRDRAA